MYSFSDIFRQFFFLYFLLLGNNYEASSESMTDSSWVHLLEESLFFFKFKILNMQLSGRDPGMNLEISYQSWRVWDNVEIYKGLNFGNCMEFHILGHSPNEDFGILAIPVFLSPSIFHHPWCRKTYLYILFSSKLMTFFGNIWKSLCFLQNLKTMSPIGVSAFSPKPEINSFMRGRHYWSPYKLYSSS